jgi:hypothetical protein
MSFILKKINSETTYIHINVKTILRKCNIEVTTPSKGVGGGSRAKVFPVASEIFFHKYIKYPTICEKCYPS